MTWSKRLLDLGFASLLLAILSPLLVGLVLWLLIRQGRPVFHVAERMKGVDRPFMLWKLRTMTVAEGDAGVSGGDKAARITPAGAWLRRRRLDELPQLWNILKGDLSFVGPRPPLREYVERYPELYAKVLRSRNMLRIWAAGFLMAVPLSVPLVNLVIPILGAATFTHLFHRLAPQAPYDRTSPDP